MAAEAFTATVDIIGANPFVRPPDTVLDVIFKAARKDKSPIPVRGTINSAVFQQSLVRFQGHWRLYINNVMAKSAGLQYAGSIVQIVGQSVELSVEYDPNPVMYRMVPEFEVALGTDARARAAYTQLAPGRQKEILRYLASMKSAATLQRNIARIMQHLRGEETDALYALMHRQPKS